MKDKIIITGLLMISITCSLTLITALFVLLPWLGFSFILFLAFLRYLIWQADKEYKNRTAEQQERLDNLYCKKCNNHPEKCNNHPEKCNNHPEKRHNADELIQIAEMFRDSMISSPAEGSLAYNVTVKAINNYYKTA